MQTSTTQHLIEELNQATVDRVLAWLRKALSGGDRRLPLDRDDPPSLGIERLKPYLEKDTRENLQRALLILLQEWIDKKAPSAEPGPAADWIAALLDLVSAYEPVGAVDRLWDLLQKRKHFDALPRPTQIGIQNLIEEKIGSLSHDIWYALVARDPARFGVTAFGAMARFDLNAALGVLPDLPDQPEVLYSLEYRVRWLLSILPTETRQDALAQISQALIQAPKVSKCMREAFQYCEAPLPEPVASKKEYTALEKFLPGYLGEKNSRNPRPSKLCQWAGDEQEKVA